MIVGWDAWTPSPAGTDQPIRSSDLLQPSIKGCALKVSWLVLSHSHTHTYSSVLIHTHTLSPHLLHTSLPSPHDLVFCPLETNGSLMSALTSAVIQLALFEAPIKRRNTDLTAHTHILMQLFITTSRTFIIIIVCTCLILLWDCDFIFNTNTSICAWEPCDICSTQLSPW